MKLIIDIPEELYRDIKEHGLCGHCSDREIVSEAISNGTPLPKGHGRLIDVSHLFTVTECRPDGTEFTYVPYTSIENAEAVIEADREVEDES